MVLRKDENGEKATGVQAAVEYLRSWLYLYEECHDSAFRGVHVQMLLQRFKAGWVFRRAVHGGLVSFRLSQTTVFEEECAEGTPRKRSPRNRTRGDKAVDLQGMDQTQGFVYDLQQYALQLLAGEDQDPTEPNFKGTLSKQRIKLICQRCLESAMATTSKRALSNSNYSKQPFSLSSDSKMNYLGLSVEEQDLVQLCSSVFWTALWINERKSLESFCTNERNSFHRQLDKYILGSTCKKNAREIDQRAAFWTLLRSALGVDEHTHLPELRDLLGIDEGAKLPPWVHQDETLPVGPGIDVQTHGQLNCLFNFGGKFAWLQGPADEEDKIRVRRERVVAILMAMCKLLFCTEGLRDPSKCVVNLQKELKAGSAYRELSVLWMTMLHRYCGWSEKIDHHRNKGTPVKDSISASSPFGRVSPHGFGQESPAVDDLGTDDDSDCSIADTLSTTGTPNSVRSLNRTRICSTQAYVTWSRRKTTKRDYVGKQHRRLTLKKTMWWMVKYCDTLEAREFLANANLDVSQCARALDPKLVFKKEHADERPTKRQKTAKHTNSDGMPKIPDDGFGLVHELLLSDDFSI